jgi:hypothetical protein
VIKQAFEILVRKQQAVWADEVHGGSFVAEGAPQNDDPKFLFQQSNT